MSQELSADEKMQRSIDRRRAMEAERLQRVMDIKTRTMGLDKDAIEQQIKEKKDREQAEKEREAAFARESELIQRQLAAMELEQHRAKKEMAQDVDKYRVEAQRKEPQPRIRDEAPPTAEDRAAPSGLQKFEGEDHMKKQREKEQQEEQRLWLARQQKDKEEREATEKELERLHALRQREITERTSELERLQTQTRRAMAMEARDYNKAMADAKLQADKEELIAKTLADLEEIQGHTDSVFLTEDPKTAVSTADPSRVIPAQFKGMSPAQLRQIREEQLAQAASKGEEKKREAEQQRKWEQQEIAVMRSALLREREIERQRRDIQKAVMEENAQGTQIATQRKAQMEETFANKVTGDFFDQFGKSSR